MSGVLLVTLPTVRPDVTPHVGAVATLIYVAVALMIALFVVRPELWRRIFFERIDPRPAALMRIGLGLVLLGTWLGMLEEIRLLFTDEGLWLPEAARLRFGGRLSQIWDPQLGFEDRWHALGALWGKFSILHFRSDPLLVYSLYGVLIGALSLMTLGLLTRPATLVAWLAMHQLYGHNEIYIMGGDLVGQVLLFLGVFTRWGEAYAVDSWRRRRQAILGEARTLPALRKIPAWPLRLSMLQLAVIYCATGLLKTGYTWKNGSALYYALNLEQFRRVPMADAVAVLQYVGVLPLMTWVVRWWELLFPLALLGVVLRCYERERREGSWEFGPTWRRITSWTLAGAFVGASAYVVAVWAFYYWTPTVSVGIARDWMIPSVWALLVGLAAASVAVYRACRRHAPRVIDFLLRWILGRRLWLGLGVAMHLGIELTMNVGTFSEVMLVSYVAWFSGNEVDAFWRYALSRPCRPGESPRPARSRSLSSRLLAPLDHLRFRKPGAAHTVRHRQDEPHVRRAALLRPWDLGGRLRFAACSSVPVHGLRVVTEDGRVLEAAEAGKALIRILPGLWWLWPATLVPGLSDLASALATRLLGQR